MTCAQWDESAFFPAQNDSMAMKKLFWILPFALTASLGAAPNTNSAAGGTNAPAEKNEAAAGEARTTDIDKPLAE